MRYQHYILQRCDAMVFGRLLPTFARDGRVRLTLKMEVRVPSKQRYQCIDVLDVMSLFLPV